VITTADLKTRSKADLSQMAKQLGIASHASMKRDELVVAIAKKSKVAKKPVDKKPVDKKLDAKKTSPTKKSASPKVMAASTVNGTTKKVAPSKTAAKKSVSKSAGAKTAVVKPVAPKLKAAEPKAKPSKAAAKKSEAAAKSTAPAKPNSKAKTVESKVTANGAPAKKAAQPQSAVPKAQVPKKVVEKKPPKPKATTTNPTVLKKIRELQLQRESGKDISFRPTLVRPPGAAEPIWEKEPLKDRIALFVRDAYWMHASWDITRNAIDRARSAMAEQWHGAKPILRLLKLDDGSVSSAAETVERDIEIHGGLRNWYISWSGEATSFRVMVGYLSAAGRFHAIAESNVVRTPAAGASDAVDEHWSNVSADSEHIFALSGGYDSERETSELQEILEDRLHRNLGAPALAKLGASADGPFRRRGDFHFDMDIELVVYGSTVSDGYLTLNGEPVTLRQDGTFAVRLPFPDRRQVLPAVACTRDGSQQRTIVVAVERNTKIMEPLEQERDTGE
jgi:uncharacterized protein